MPAEWAPHAKCWMAWPCRAEVWGDRLVETRRNYAEDARAREVFEEAFPGSEIVRLPVADIETGGGGIHCITQQQPAV